MISRGDFLGFEQRRATHVSVAVMPEPVIMRHRYTPLRHRTLRVVFGNMVESLARLLVLKRVQERNGTLKVGLHGLRA